MTCFSCKSLDENKKAKGKVSGCKYYCKKHKCYVSGDNSKCEKYEKSYSRSNDTCNKIYKEGKDFYNDDTPFSFYLFILIALVIISIIMRFVDPELFG